jgi:hypothetical protein
VGKCGTSMFDEVWSKSWLRYNKKMDQIDWLDQNLKAKLGWVFRLLHHIYEPKKTIGACCEALPPFCIYKEIIGTFVLL